MATAQESLSLRRYGASPGGHAHGHFQVLVGLEGVLDLEIEGRGECIAAGDARLVAPGEWHDFESHRGSHCLVLDTGQPAWARCGSKPERNRQAAALAHYLADALRRGQPLAAQWGPALLLEAWAPAPVALRHRRAIDWTHLAAWARQRLAQPLTPADLAAQALLSPSQFALRCREAQGVSPMQWLRGLRLLHARQLRDGGVAVAQAARLAGYRSPSALTAALRRQGR